MLASACSHSVPGSIWWWYIFVAQHSIIYHLYTFSVISDAFANKPFCCMVPFVFSEDIPVPSPSLDRPTYLVWAMTVWRIRGKIIRTVPCYNEYDSCAQWYACTYKQFLQLAVCIRLHPAEGWRGCQSGARCKWFTYGPADATATLSSLASLKSRLVLPFWCQLTQVVLEERPLNKFSVSLSSSVNTSGMNVTWHHHYSVGGWWQL